MKNTNAKLTDPLFVQQLRQRITISRIIIFASTALIIAGAWVLYRQHLLTYTQSQLQLVRMGIMGAGVLSLGAALLGSRWSVMRDQIEHESRVHADQQRQLANVRFQTALEFSVVPKVLVDHDGFINYANPALGTLVGRAPMELIGQTVADIFTTLTEPPKGAPTFTELPATVTADYCQVVRSVDQSVRTLRRVIVPIPQSRGESYARIYQFDDVTQAIEDQRILADDKHVLAERVEQRTKALALVNNELESFAYSVSHDLRGPLRAIDGFGKVLRHSAAAKLTDSELDYLDRIISATTRMGDLIDSLLRMSRLATAKLDLQDIDLTDLVEDVVLNVRLQYPDHNVTVEVQPDMRVRGDRVLLRNAFTNMISNSFKFTRDIASPRVQIRMLPRNRFWHEIAVSDNGAGFEQKYADKLFKPFQRLHRSDEFEGHGIGLASIKKVVDRHGGAISAYGEQGKGATIRLTLPVALAQMEPGASTANGNS